MISFLKALFCLFCALPFLANAQSGFVVNDYLSEYGITLNEDLSVLEDNKGELTLEEVVALGRTDFAPASTFSPESNRSTFWVKISISSQGKSQVGSILRFNHVSHITAYLMTEGVLNEEAYGGEYSKKSERRIQDARLYLSLEIPRGQNVIYLKIVQRKNFAPILNFELTDETGFYAGLQNSTFYRSLVFGCFGILFLYGMVLYIGNRHRSYLWLSLTVIFKAIFFSQMIGYFTDAFAPDSPKFAWDMLVFLAYGSGITNILLIKDFLYLKKTQPRFNKILNAVLVLLGILCLVVFYIKFHYDNYLLANKIGFLTYLPQGIFLIYMFVKLMPKIPVYKRPVVIGITGFAALTLFTSTNFLFNLEKSYGQYTWNEVIGTLVFLVLYFYTLGREMQLNEKEKNVALARVNEITRNQKEELEKTVRDRTSELIASKQEIEIKNDKLQERNGQIEVLLKEIHHRVKNNLQVISSLLDLQSRGIEDEEALATFMEGQNRVKAMALIHQKLYQNEDLATIDFEEYARLLVAELGAIYKRDSKVKTSVRAGDQKEFDIDIAVPLGLILNELISNAYKYAFTANDQATLSVSLETVGENRHKLTVADNGKGLPADLDLSKAKSLGLRLVRRLAKQLYGTVTYMGDKGARFVVIFTDTIERKTA